MILPQCYATRLRGGVQGNPNKVETKTITEPNMATKRKRKATPERRRHVITVEARDSTDDALARTLTRPETQAAGTMQVWDDNHEVNALTRELTEQTALTHRGD